ncbi:MAG: M48 family metallopeptidase [Deltaproteobacteria bacterium]|nr:M48 family metallopeptidase [Deltaproteobacteria bacterium]
MALLITLIALYILFTGFVLFLEYLNVSYLEKNRGKVPPGFEGSVGPDFLERASGYLRENTKFGAVAYSIERIVALIFVFAALGYYNNLISSLKLSFPFSGVIFFMLLFYADALLTAPLSLYRTFGIEKRYGFTTMTPGLWAVDFMKSLVVSTVILAAITYAALKIVEMSPALWWFWIWALFLAFSVFMLYISPYVIEPLFNKFEPITDAALEESIREVADRAGIKVKRVLKIDASRRTTHTNAYFTGIGRVKRIVLYDTLLERLTGAEITAVLAHEIGHWKKRHVLKSLLFLEAFALVALFTAYILMQGESLNGLFHIRGGGFFTKAVVLGFIGGVLSTPFEPLFNYLSRRREYQADAYSCAATNDPGSMESSLIKLSKDNLSNLYPHPLYAAFHYSHPPVTDRIRHIRRARALTGR